MTTRKELAISIAKLEEQVHGLSHISRNSRISAMLNGAQRGLIKPMKKTQLFDRNFYLQNKRDEMRRRDYTIAARSRDGRPVIIAEVHHYNY